jgi:hypothetical protein
MFSRQEVDVEEKRLDFYSEEMYGVRGREEGKRGHGMATPTFKSHGNFRSIQHPPLSVSPPNPMDGLDARMLDH